MTISMDCWCYATKKQVNIEGKIVGKRQAELLEVTDCEEKGCSEYGAVDCLVGKLREGKWR